MNLKSPDLLVLEYTKLMTFFMNFNMNLEIFRNWCWWRINSKVYKNLITSMSYQIN